MIKVLPYLLVAVVAAVATWLFARKDACGARQDDGPCSVVHSSTAKTRGTAVKSEKPVRREEKRNPLSLELAAATATDDLSGASVRMRNDELEPTLAEKDLKPETLEELKKIFAQYESGKMKDEHFLQSLCCYQPRVVLAAARNILRFGTKNEKCNALCAVGLLYSTDARHALEVRQGEVPSDSQEPPGVMVSDTPAAVVGAGSSGGEDAAVQADLQNQSCGVIDAVSAGLSDSDADVRNAAFDVMKALPVSESSVVASQAMGGKDAELQAAMLDAVKDSRDDLSVRISLMGAGSEDASVRAAALANLKGVSGQTFQSQQDASAWYSEHAQEFQQIAEGQQSQINTNE